MSIHPAVRSSTVFTWAVILQAQTDQMANGRRLLPPSLQESSTRTKYGVTETASSTYDEFSFPPTSNGGLKRVNSSRSSVNINGLNLDDDQPIPESNETIESLCESFESMTVNNTAVKGDVGDEGNNSISDLASDALPIHLPVVVGLSEERWNKKKFKKSKRVNHGASRSREYYRSQLIFTLADDPIPALSNPIISTTILERINQLG